MSKLLKTLKAFWYGLFYGLKTTNDIVLTQEGLNTPVGTHIQQEVSKNSVAKDLLKGEVTQQVEELRYRTYTVDRESKGYEYYTPLKAIKDGRDSKFVKYDNSDGLELITIQPNNVLTENVYDGIKGIDFMSAELVDKNGNISVNVGDFYISEKYNIDVERDFNPRFKIEAFTTRLVVKKIDDKGWVMLDFYVSKYPKNKDLKSIYFVKEAERIMGGYKQSDILSFNRVSFETSHAYGLNDMILFKFEKIMYVGCVEYDGHYIFKFKAYAYVNGKDLTDEFYSKSMDDKYKNNEKKEMHPLDVFSESVEVKEFECAGCGKIIRYDELETSESEPSTGRDITEEIEDDNDEMISYIDLQISEQTFGKRLCKNCLKKYLNDLNKQ